jgi:phenylacetic acid degradation operon negative regulatory protein
VPVVDERRARVADLIGDQSLSARSVLATALLGADQPHLTVGELVAMASLFGISDGAARTCLWRMVSTGELTSDDGMYALAGGLLERRERVDEASRFAATRQWDGTWELAVVSLERRSAADRLALRKAASALHLAELREGVWIRPDNLDPDRVPTLRAVLDRQCVHFHGAASDIPAETVRSLFNLDDWAADARRFSRAVHDEVDAEAVAADDFVYWFALSVAVVRHLQLDPLLPAEFIPEQWPGHDLRSAYRRFDEVFKQRLNTAFR